MFSFHWLFYWSCISTLNCCKICSSFRPMEGEKKKKSDLHFFWNKKRVKISIWPLYFGHVQLIWSLPLIHRWKWLKIEGKNKDQIDYYLNIARDQMIVTKKYKNQNDTLIIFSKKGQIRPHIILAMLRNINPRFHNNMSSVPRFERKRRIARVNISINL